MSNQFVHVNFISYEGIILSALAQDVRHSLARRWCPRYFLVRHLPLLPFHQRRALLARCQGDCLVNGVRAYEKAEFWENLESVFTNA